MCLNCCFSFGAVMASPVAALPQQLNVDNVMFVINLLSFLIKSGRFFFSPTRQNESIDLSARSIASTFDYLQPRSDHC